MTCAGLSAEALSERSGVPVESICDAIDYRPELSPEECARLAEVLGLNEVGLCALASGKYPLPEPNGLPFQVWPLRMAHGIGVVNAYIVGEAGGRGLLFDTGPGSGALESVWPHARRRDRRDLRHPRRGGARGRASRRGRAVRCLPRLRAGRRRGALRAGRWERGRPSPRAGSASPRSGRPGTARCTTATTCARLSVPTARTLLVSGDLVFAGSAGGPYHCHKQLRAHLRRVLAAVPADTIVAPGHGPMTTAGNELRFNPFVA